MTWADSVPNLLIGLREGLEAGLVVSILLAAVRKATAGREVTAGPEVTASRGATRPVWLGVLGAVSLSVSFAAVLTFSTSVLSSQAQEALGGVLSVLAVGLVTAMIFWMRRTAASLSARLKGDVAKAAVLGAGALTLTAFLAVGREGLETTLFLWTAARASGQTVAPLLGAAAGIAAAVVLCWLLYRRAVRLNVGVFFNRTAIALIVIAAGVLAYGLGDLQDAGLLSGQRWIAFDLTAHLDPGSAWVSVITGVTDLEPTMTVLQVAAWLAYLAVVIPAFITAGRTATEPGQAATQPGQAATEPRKAATEPGKATTGAPGRWERLAASRPWATAGVLVAVPALVAGTTIAALPAATAATATAPTLTVTKTACAPEWSAAQPAAQPGTQTFTISNQSGLAGEIDLDDASGGVVGEIETIGPGTSAQLTATLRAGAYTFTCLMGGQPATASQQVQVSGATTTPDPVAVKPVTLNELAGPNRQYEAYAARDLVAVAADVAKIQADLRRGDLAAARTDWLAAQLRWEEVGASYDSFGDLGLAVDGLPDGLPHGVADKNFTGLHRLEYGLWHGQRAAALLPVAKTLALSIEKIQRNLTTDDLAGDPANLPVRAHEILEDALRDHLSGIDDQGAGAAFAMTYADTQVTRTVLGYLTPLLDERDPGLVATATSQLTILRRALRAGDREDVDAAIGALLETLASVPDLLEVPPTH